MNATLADRVRAMLASVPEVEEKKMFGGITFMVGGKMCVSAGKNRIMARIDPALHEREVKKSGVTAVVMRGRQYRGYVHVSEGALRTDGQLRRWIKLALDYNKRLE